jgi:hypothetical protein
MDEIFSCRNCIHNCGQSLLIGRGAGFCIKHDSLLLNPRKSTCKYLHRKDLPYFVVDEGLREHAAEFAMFSAIADLVEHTPIERRHYSEKFTWEHRKYDPIIQSLAQYHKTRPVWVFLQAMSGGIDGRRSLTHASLVRRYMDNCGTWRSSYRFALAMVQELPNTPQFREQDFITNPDDNTRKDAVWDVFFARLSGLQEYGFHSGLEELMWATDRLNGALADLDWEAVAAQLDTKAAEWTDLIIKHATDEGAFFPVQPPLEEDEEFESL